MPMVRPRGRLPALGQLAAGWLNDPLTTSPWVRSEPHLALGEHQRTDRPAQPPSTPAGTILVFLEPLYDNGLDGVIPGSSCIVNAYTSNHELMASSPDMSTTRRLVLHGVDAVGLIHALLLRIQALVLPIQTLVFAGH